MKRKIVVALLLIFTLSCSLLAFTACGDGEKQVPVYQGMTITEAKNETLSLLRFGQRSSGAGSINSNKDNNGNHYGNYKGDSTDRNDNIDEENPYPDNEANENIEEEIKSSLNVVGSPDTIYYAEPNQDIYINIHIDNPDNFEIMSFTLNGKKYSTYMFEEGSDMETIVLKYNVGDSAGIVEYTIDAIKYIDGTEIKDVIIDGNKTVMAGIKTQHQVSANISGVDIGTNSLGFMADVKDNYALVEFSSGTLKAVLYDGFNIVAEKDLQVGENSVSFDNLKTNTLYQYAVVGYYDDLSGDGFGMRVLYKDAFYTNSVVLFDNITVGQEDISFDFYWDAEHQNKSLSTLKLYKEDKLVRELDVDASSIGELLSNNAYKLVAEYQNGDKTESISIEFTTLAKATPEILIINPTKTQTSVGFEISETDADSVGAVTKIELVHASGTVLADSLDQRAFANLLSNNAYTVKLTYVYNLNDGEGEHTVTKELVINTKAKAAPSFTIKNENISVDSINAEYDITDLDNILSYYKIELYKGNALVNENSEKKIEFSSLSYYTDYTVKITYKYDLNDGSGEQTKVYDYGFKTLPHIDVTECNIANTSAVSEGETIFMSVKLDNPLGMSIESVVINGQTYKVTGASTKNKIFVEIVYNGQFTGGDTYLKVDKVNAKIDDTALSVEPETELYDNVFINGKLEVIKVEYVNECLEPVEWAFLSDVVYVLITLDNPTGYSIKNVNTEITNLVKVDDNKWYYPIQNGARLNVFSLTNLTYYNDYIEKSLSYSNMQAYCYKVASDETKYISTPADLLNMHSGYYYELAGDIDLAGLEWRGETFDGVFDGKGYSIKNMSYVGSVKNSSIDLGLFAGGTGIIKNLNIEETTIIVDITSDDGNECIVRFGGVVTYASSYLCIDNCSLDEYSIISIKSSAKGQTVAGGIIGYWENGITLNITNCKNSASISASAISDYPSYVGGIIGYADVQSNSTLNITGCENSGCVNSTYYAGGIIGCANVQNNSALNITSCKNSASVSAVGCAGGIIGYTWGSTVTDCENSGCVNSTYCAGGIIGDSGNSTVTASKNSADISASERAGGIIGSSGNSSVTSCKNSGKISASSNNSYPFAGGIIGYAVGSTVTCCENEGEVSGGYFVGGITGLASNSTIESCKNSGKVSANSTNSEACTGGGIVGQAENSTIKGSENSADVSANATNNTARAGGIVGAAWSSSVTSCKNSGEVSADANSTASAGGIIGWAYSSSVTSCKNRGEVSSSATNGEACAGGIVAYFDYSTGTITSCQNSGDVSSTNHSGGIIGLASSSSVTVASCQNSGDVSGGYFAGGIVGYINDGNSSTINITSCQNSGEVNARDSVGGIVGRADVYNSSFKLTSCYSLKKGDGVNNENGVDCTVEQLNSKAFYTETLGWSEDVWDFSELDVENGKYPILK